MRYLVIKPEWKDAPEWANYLVRDSEVFWWYECEPIWHTHWDYWHCDAGQKLVAGYLRPHPEDSLEKRP